MKKTTVLLAFACVSLHTFAWGENVMSSYYEGKRYDFTFRCEQLEMSPSWDEEEGNPLRLCKVKHRL